MDPINRLNDVYGAERYHTGATNSARILRLDLLESG